MQYQGRKKLTSAKLHSKRLGYIVGVSSGMPFSRGVLRESDTISFMQGGLGYEADFKVLNRWHDGSVKNVRLDTILPDGFDTTELVDIYISAQEDSIAPERSQTTKVSSIKLERDTASKYLFDALLLNGEKVAGPLSIQATGRSGLLKVKCVDQVDRSSTSHIDRLALKGQLATHRNQESIHFTCRLELHSAQQALFVSFEVHNPNAALHPNGIWDIGDPGSVYFYDLSLNLALTKPGALRFKIEQSADWGSSDAKEFSIVQASSGNENWNSLNHLTRRGRVELPFKGYRVLSNNDVLNEGQQANPVINVNSKDINIGLSLDDFWQNFPSSLSYTAKGLEVGLFPKEVAQEYELQAGEKKTQRFAISLQESQDQADYLQLASLQFSTSYLAQAGVTHYLDNHASESALNKIIANGLDGDSNFFAKREQIDEYGWRNFGDIYADHELLEYKGDSIISHYNNQYDPLYGFIRQYYLSGDKRWWELADDLAKHILDIDLYHTELDRPEYNHGLFWHTDHYVDASTSTHRTYSKDQIGQHDFAGLGGGPAGQHCYTEGLTHYYQCTGDELAKQAVLNMVQWITYYYEGAGTLLDCLLAYKNRYIVDFKHPFSTGHVYPLDRGVGHYINALLDAYSLTNEASYLARVDVIIRGTVHPQDPIEQRDLLNADEFWFYIVFYQSVARFLIEKESIGEIDQAFEYARASLMHYAVWMADNERPYLEAPEGLEFPNHTWAAQDLRKSVLFYQAYRFSNNADTRFLDKARFFRDYVIREISGHETQELSRILAILMQNQGVDQMIDSGKVWHNYGAINFDAFGTSPMLKPKSQLTVIVKALFSVLRNFKPRKEWAWLNARIGKLQRSKYRITT